ncbi:MAG: hypothetical protein IKO72_13760 [Kiritimatiellae bacterium]|nr:hypothetical protein [Kiritimatiellia bacterium]
MSMACVGVIVSSVLSVLILMVTILGVIYSHLNARTTQKISLIDRRVEVYSLFRSLVATLSRAHADAQRKMPVDGAAFSTDWIEYLQSDIEIIRFYTKLNLDTGSLMLLQLKDLLIPQFTAAHYFFLKEGVKEGLDALIEQLDCYGKAHKNYGTTSTPFTVKDLSVIAGTIRKGEIALKSMEGDMTLRNCLNR